jgi:hypothetical protein
MTALTTIFMHVVSKPLEQTASNDIALMEAVVGFFGRLEFVTSGVAAFTKTGEFVRQARKVVEKARGLASSGSESTSQELDPDQQRTREVLNYGRKPSIGIENNSLSQPSSNGLSAPRSATSTSELLQPANGCMVDDNWLQPWTIIENFATSPTDLGLGFGTGQASTLFMASGS